MPVIRLVREYPRDRPPERYLDADTVIVGAFQTQDETRPTIFIGLQDDARVSIEVRDESADRLADVLRQVVDRVTR